MKLAEFAKKHGPRILEELEKMRPLLRQEGFVSEAPYLSEAGPTAEYREDPWVWTLPVIAPGIEPLDDIDIQFWITPEYMYAGRHWPASIHWSADTQDPQPLFGMEKKFTRNTSEDERSFEVLVDSAVIKGMLQVVVARLRKLAEDSDT